MQARTQTSRQTVRASLQGTPLRVQRASFPTRSSRHGLRVRAYVGEYISQAFAKIFSVADDEKVDWKKTTAPFTGKITHHEQTRLRHLADVVKTVKGCTDPSALNFVEGANMDDGSCEYAPGVEATEKDLKGYLEGAVERVFGHQFKGDDSEPEWEIMPFTGEIKSQREIEKMVEFGKVVDDALSKPVKE